MVEAEEAMTQVNVAEGAPQSLKPKILNLFLTWSTALFPGSTFCAFSKPVQGQGDGALSYGISRRSVL